MCKAQILSKTILNAYQESQNYIDGLYQRLSELDKTQQDLLHFIENDNFNACEGYFYAKQIQEVRQERRQIKYEIETMKILVDTIQPRTNIKKIEIATNKILIKDKKLHKLVENKTYNPRVLRVAR